METRPSGVGRGGQTRGFVSDGTGATRFEDLVSRFLGPECELPPELDQEQRAVLLRPGYVAAERFEVVELLGFGGMGAVYHVRDRNLHGQDKALKVMLPSLLRSEAARERFLSEVRISQNLRHDGIVTVYDLGEDKSRGFCFFTMEYVPGVTLHRLLKERGGRLPANEALDIACQICTALEYAHEHTIHRDLKPQNIMVRPDGRIKILDFGLAKVMSPGRMTKSSMALGTAYYQAPEQSIHLGEIDQRADIYSIGVMLYEMLTGVIPVGHVKAPSKEAPDVPKALDAVVLRCLERKPQERYSSTAALASALAGAMANPVGRWATLLLGRPLPRIHTRTAAMVLVCIAIAFAMFPYLSQRLSRVLNERKHPAASLKPAPTQQVVRPTAEQVPRVIPTQNKPATAASVAEAEARAMEAYNQNPKKCDFCKAILPYSKRDEAFCNATCESDMKLNRKYDRQPNYCYSCGNAVPFEYRDSGFCSPKCAEQYSQYLAQQQQSEMIRLQDSQALSQKRKENQQHSNSKTLTSTDARSGGLVFDGGGVQWAAP